MSNVYEDALVALLGVLERQGMEAGQLLHELTGDGFASFMIAVGESPAVKEAAERLIRRDIKRMRA